MSDAPYTWLEAFLWTLALEQPVYVFLLRGKFKSWWAPCALCLVINAVTHPVVWDAVSTYPESILLMELFAVAVEGLIAMLVIRLSARKWQPRAAFGAALAANAFSYLVGPALIQAVR